MIPKENILAKKCAVVEDDQHHPEKGRRIRIAESYYDMFSDDRYLEQFQGTGFEPHMVKLFCSLIHPEDYVFDIGANVGCTSILFGEFAQRVFSFEPSPSTYSYLQKNIKQANLKNVELFNIGLGDTAGESEITFAPSNRSGGFVSNITKASEGHVTEKITISTIDSFFKEREISAVNFIKIDVEGFEGRVIRGGTETLATQRPVVVLELNH